MTTCSKEDEDIQRKIKNLWEYFVTRAVERRGRKMKIGLRLHLEGWVTNEKWSKGRSGD